jgi:hypothetical protein
MRNDRRFEELPVGLSSPLKPLFPSPFRKLPMCQVGPGAARDTWTHHPLLYEVNENAGGLPSHWPALTLFSFHSTGPGSRIAIIFGYPRNHLHPRSDCPTDSSAAPSDRRTIGDVTLSTWYKSHSEVRRVGMVRVNLSRGRQPVAVERGQKNRALALFY